MRSITRKIRLMLGFFWFALLHPSHLSLSSHHMRVGSRITGYLALDLELGRFDCTFERTPFRLHVPETCPYAEHGEQTYYVPVITLRQDPLECSGGHIITGTKRGDSFAMGQVIYQQKKRALLDYVLRDRETRRKT